MRPLMRLVLSAIKKGRLIAAALAVFTAAAVSSGGFAFAYFKTGALGAGSASTGAAPSAITVATNATTATALQPGGTGDLVVTATNPNGVPVKIVAISLGTVTGCATPALTLVTPNTTYLPVTIPAHATSQRFVLAGALSMGSGASNDCQGKTLTVNLSSVTVEQ